MEDDKGNLCVVSYASHTLQPYEKSMKNYSSAKLELLALKWSVCKKFRDYLIGSKFTMLTDNNPLIYVHTSRLGASQIHWLSNLVLFDFDIRYCVGKSNQAADALSWWPENPNSSSESSDEEEEWETISYEMVCQILDHHLDSTKLPYSVKYEVQTNIADVEVANVSLGLNQVNLIDIQLNEVKLFNFLFLQVKWLNIRRETLNCPLSMNTQLVIINLSCLKYTMLGLSLSGDYFSSMTSYL